MYAKRGRLDATQSRRKPELPAASLTQVAPRVLWLPARKLPRIANEHHELNWVDADKREGEASCPFDYAARLTEVMLLGVVAHRAGKKISYDAPNMRVTNVVAANDYLRRDYRQGWSI